MSLSRLVAWTQRAVFGWLFPQNDPNIGSEAIEFVTLGLAVLDDIWIGSSQYAKEVLGGSGTYATLGARLFLPPPRSRSIGWLIRAGADFPTAVEEQLEKWQVNLRLQKVPGRRSTRGLLKYLDKTFGAKNFEYTTPVLTLLPEHLEHTPFLASPSFHLMLTPQQLESQLKRLLELRSLQGATSERPLIVWEPTPPHCVPRNLDPCLSAASLVDVFSPNHLELQALFGDSQRPFNRSCLEALAKRFLDSGVGPKGEGAVIIRAGEHGCLVKSRSVGSTWVPAFYNEGQAQESNVKIVDTTGAGNAFLGGFAIGFLKTRNVLEGAYHGCVAASFALEQIGAPVLQVTDSGKEVWNGEDVQGRLQKVKEMLASQIYGDGRRPRS